MISIFSFTSQTANESRELAYTYERRANEARTQGLASIMVQNERRYPDALSD